MDLVSYLARECDVELLSDLRLTLRCKKVIDKTETKGFPLKDWNDAVHYLCKTEISFDLEEMAKEYLLKYSL